MSDKFARDKLLNWERKSEYHQDAQLGTPGDGVLFTISYQPTCHRRGMYKLLIDVCGGDNHELWGCFDSQDQPVRYYHSEANAKSEAEALARVLWAGRTELDKPSIEAGYSTDEHIKRLVKHHDDALEEIQKLRSQLPNGMQHCTIVFKECSKGHGWLTATNWVQHDCPTCERDSLRADIARLTAERDAARAELQRITAGWKCGCGATYSPEIALQACDHSHCVAWPHEWVVPAEKELRETILRLRAELASRPAVLPDDVRALLSWVDCDSCSKENSPKARELLNKYAAGVPQDAASRLQAGEVAWLARNDDCRTFLFINKPVKSSRGVWSSYSTSFALGCLQLGLKPGECRGIILTEPITPPQPYDVAKLPGYQWHNESLSVFAANGRTVCVKQHSPSQWQYAIVESGFNKPRVFDTREAAERAASAYVTGAAS